MFKTISVCLVLAAITVHDYAWAKAPDVDSETMLINAVASGKPTLLEFGALWCASCLRMQPIIEAVAMEKEFSKKINVISVDVDKNENLATRYKVHSIPIQIFLDESGKEVKRHFGAMEKKELLKLLRGNFKFL